MSFCRALRTANYASRGVFLRSHNLGTAGRLYKRGGDHDDHDHHVNEQNPGDVRCLVLTLFDCI